MKKLAFILAVAFSLNASAQTTPPDADTLVPINSAIQVVPVMVNNLVKDTAYQLTWAVLSLTRDTAVGANSYVQMFDRKARRVYEANVYIPKEVIRVWGTDDTVIDDYILNYYNLTRRSSNLRR